MLRGPRGVLGVAIGAAAMLAGCAQTSEEDYQAGLAAFDALPDEAKAYACADGWHAAQHGVEQFVIVERCGQGATEVIASQPLSAAYEQAEQAYARQYYAANPPDPRQLRKADAEVLCAQDEAEMRADITEWRQQTDFPSWEGVEYVPSVEHEVAKLLIWQDVACPLLDG